MGGLLFFAMPAKKSNKRKRHFWFRQSLNCPSVLYCKLLCCQICSVDTQVISLAEVMERMDKGEVFSLRFVTCNRIKKSGGKLMEVRKGQKVGKYGVRMVEKYTTGKSGRRVLKKNPDHYSNFTRNIVDLSSNKTIKIHCRLITRFNGIRVRY